jgi:hypothetical protein
VVWTAINVFRWECRLQFRGRRKRLTTETSRVYHHATVYVCFARGQPPEGARRYHEGRHDRDGTWPSFLANNVSPGGRVEEAADRTRRYLDLAPTYISSASHLERVEVPMRNGLGLFLSTSFLLATMAMGPCGRQEPLGGTVSDSGTRSGNDATLAIAGKDGATTTDCCCPDGIVSGSACNLTDLADCWTQCASGHRGHYYCTDSGWTAGKGLYPCTEDIAGDARPSDSGSSPAAALTGTVPCADGTGLTDCCPESVSESSVCDGEVAECFTKCQSGYRGRLSCGAGVWNAGKGLFPCGTWDAGGEPISN